jgi:hypothetical protein
MYISRDVIFHEDRFPFSKASPIPESSSVSLPIVLPQLLFPPPTTICPLDPPTLSSSSSHSRSSLSSSNNSPAVPNMPCSNSYANQPPARVHPIRTRSMNNIVQQRQLTYGRIWYPVPQALVAASSPAHLEPTCYSNAVHIPEW